MIIHEIVISAAHNNTTLEFGMIITGQSKKLSCFVSGEKVIDFHP